MVNEKTIEEKALVCPILNDPITGEPLKEFRLIYGCISKDNRITSRDISNPQYFDTLDKARLELEEHKKFYNTIGYKIWFAEFARREGNNYIKINF